MYRITRNIPPLEREPTQPRHALANDVVILMRARDEMLLELRRKEHVLEGIEMAIKAIST